MAANAFIPLYSLVVQRQMIRLQVGKHPARIIARLNFQEPLEIFRRKACKNILTGSGIVGVDEGVVQTHLFAQRHDTVLNSLQCGFESIVIFGVIVRRCQTDDFGKKLVALK